MDKFLFTDGTNGVREAYSKEELLSLVHSAANPAKTRIWIFNTHEWTDYPSFLRQHPGFDHHLNREEYQTALAHAQELGFENLLVQPLATTDDFFPDFQRPKPFRGNP